jgi:hypothetical protein
VRGQKWLEIGGINPLILTAFNVSVIIHRHRHIISLRRIESMKNRLLRNSTPLALLLLALNAPMVAATDPSHEPHANDHAHHHGDDGHADEHEHHHGTDDHSSEHEHHHGDDGHSSEHEHHHGDDGHTSEHEHHHIEGTDAEDHHHHADEQ